MVPSSARAKEPSSATENLVARVSISLNSDLAATSRKVFASGVSVPIPCMSGVNRKPDSFPTICPSTTTSPVTVTSAFSILFSRKRRISTDVRRLTKRCASFSCSASDKASSTLRVTCCQCQGSRNQSILFAQNVQVRIWARRAERVSISPSGLLHNSTCAANQSTGIYSTFIKNSKIVNTNSA